MISKLEEEAIERAVRESSERWERVKTCAIYIGLGIAATGGLLAVLVSPRG